MRILHITESFSAGVGQYLVLVGNAQAKSGHEVIIAHSVRSTAPDEYLDQMFNRDVQLVKVPMVAWVSPVADFKAVLALRHLIQASRPDVVHLHSSKAGALGRLASKLASQKAKVLYSPHGFAFLRRDVSWFKRQVFLLFERLGFLLGKTIVACSASEVSLAERRVGCRSVVLIENAVNLKEVPVWRGGNDGVVHVLNAGRIVAQKNPTDFRRVAESCIGSPVSFIWVGDGELTPLINACSNIEVTGWLPRDRVMTYLARSDIFLMPSLWEGMPLALIEAQAVGIPAVVFDVEGCRDVVINGVTGFVCNSIEELIEKTQLLIENPVLRRMLGENAAREAKTRFDAMRLNRELLDIYLAPL